MTIGLFAINVVVNMFHLKGTRLKVLVFNAQIVQMRTTTRGGDVIVFGEDPK